MRRALLAYTAAACLMTAFVPHAAHAYDEVDVYKCAKNAPVYNDTSITQCRARVKMYDDLANAIPQWDIVNNSPRFAAWLDQVDSMTGQTRRSALNAAHNVNDTAKVISIFSYFIATHNATAPAAPSPAPQSIPNYVPPPAKPYMPPSSDSIAFTMVNDQIMVKVTMGGMYVDMQLDTGANISSVGTDLADKLIAGGFATEAEPGQVKLADGSVVNERRLIVRTMSIGKHAVHDVTVGVVKDGVTMLLGLPVLNAIGKFTIDSANQQLTFG